MYFREDFDRYLQQAADDRRRTEEDRMYLEKLLEEVKINLIGLCFSSLPCAHSTNNNEIYPHSLELSLSCFLSSGKAASFRRREESRERDRQIEGRNRETETSLRSKPNILLTST